MEVDIKKLNNIPFNPDIKSKLEMSSAQFKEYKLEELLNRLEKAANKRGDILQFRENKLRLISHERENKLQRKECHEELNKQKKEARLEASLSSAERRRLVQKRELIKKLQERHERVLKTAVEVNQRKKQHLISLKTQITEKLEECGTQRERSRQERVKKLEHYHLRLAQAVQAAKIKEQEKLTEIATISEKKQLHAKEKRVKHIQEIKSLAEEVADKVKKIQLFVYESECI